MKKNLLFLGVIILGIGGYFFYQKKNQQQNLVANFIPDNTILLLETNEISPPKNKIIPRIPILSRANQQYQIFKQIGLTDKEISNLLLKKILYFAVLPEGKGDFSFVNYLPLNADNEDFVEKLESLSQNTTGYRVIPHTTQGFKILEVINENAKMVFSYIIQDNFLIFSNSNLAVEEAVLHQESSWVKSLDLKESLSETDSLFTVTHFNQGVINQFVSDISLVKSNSSSQTFSLFPESFEWLKPNKNFIEAIGINQERNLFSEQKSHAINNLNMIPNACSYIIDFCFDKPQKMIQNIETIVEKDTKIAKLRDKANSKFDVNFDEIYNKIESEITLCTFNVSEERFSSKVLIINQKGLLNTLKVIARNVAQEGKEDVFSVEYGSFMIVNLGIKEFPSLLFGNIFYGFEECYFTTYNDKLILASSLSAMQEYLISVTRGDVWGNSPKHKTILKFCVPANLTVISESFKIIPNFQRQVNSTWFNKIAAHNQELSSVQAQILQSNAAESRIVLLKNIEPVKNSVKYENKWVKLGRIALGAINEPLYLVNPNTKKSEILVQGGDNKLRLYEEGKQVWNYQLSGKIIGEIKNSRVFNNVVQQFLCVTNKNIYVLLRTEQGFEVKMSKPFKGYNLENFKIFENEKDHQQFATIVTSNGITYKLNKESLVLTKIEDTKRTNDMISPFPSVIISNEEFGIYLSKGGKLTVQNSLGKVSKGFPLDFGGVFNAAPILEGGENNIILVSEKGELYKISLSGKIIDKKQLFRPNNEVKFSIAVNERGNDWVLMRTDNKEVVVIDKNEQELFTVSSSIYGKKSLIYYNLGIGGKFFAINNGYSTYNFYNENGGYIGGLPIESEYKPRLSYSDSYQKVIMNITTPTTVETWSVKIR
ncbi:MAG: hypothetical protein U5N85_09150 [Arcicella sp.]|nr:hypothetical protein [Arcicella sp.]